MAYWAQTEKTIRPEVKVGAKRDLFLPGGVTMRQACDTEACIGQARSARLRNLLEVY